MSDILVEDGLFSLRMEGWDTAADAIADRIEELEAKLAKAVDGLRQCEAEIDDYIRHEYPGDHPVQARYRKRDFDANPARTTLAELTGGKDE